MNFEELVQDYLKDKKFDNPTAQQLSKAQSYSHCYLWYLSEMKVAHDTAAMASDVWVNKYALQSSEGMVLEQTPVDTWKREATALANEEIRTNPTNKDFDHWFGVFYSALEGWKYSPQGSGIYALGNPHVKASVSNCFVAPSPKDSLESIFDTGKYMARTYASRGGVGINLNGLRPYGALTNNAAKTSTGAASFMDFYSYITGMIGQEGRRGALMQCMSVHHPDIMRFIEMKSDRPLQPFFEELLGVGININDWRYSAIADRLKSTSFANVSVMLSDEFMTAVKNKTDYEQRYTFLDGKYAPISKMVSAEDIWSKLMFSAWKSAEPGILFWDLVSRESTSDYYGTMDSFTFTDPMTGEEVTLNGLNFAVSATNPCGEQPLPEDDSCCLGTHYLVAFVKNAWKADAEFDFEEYERVLRIAVRAQDNIKGIDAASLSIQSQRAMALLLRRIGLGNTGLSDCMASLLIRYDTEEAIEFVNKLYTFLRDTTYDESVKLAQEKGAFMAFDWEKHKNSPYIQRLPKPIQNNIKKYGIRNVALLTQAPNGSMSILMRNCSSGSEPMFLLASTRNMKVSGTGGDVVQYTLYHQAVQDALNAGWTKELVAEYFVAAGDVDPRTRVRMQGAMQKLIDSAISITTNLKETATVEEVRDLYEMAHEYGCKGFTVYRDKCRTGVLNAIKEDVGINKRVSRPKVTHADIHKTRYKDKSYMILVGNVDGKPIEVFGGLEDGLSLPTQYHLATLTKKSRGHYTLAVQLSEDEEDQLKINDIGKRFPAGDIITICRMISLALRNGVSVGDIVEQLSKSNIANMYDAPAVFARVLKQYIPDEEVIEKEKAKGKVCPECGEPLDFRRESGCLVELCSSCAFSNSKCG
jgi:ribonucleoside-diphosphate reductase alpha chain